MSPTVVGLDLSLTCTGLSDGHNIRVIKPLKRTGVDRLRYIRDQVLLAADSYGPDLICVEGPSYNSKGGHEHERGGLWWIVAEQLELSYQVAVIPPATLKKYATGKGNAGKDEMIVAACKRFPWFNGGNDEADALFLAAIGYEHLGAPLVEMPAINRSSLAAVWPERVVA